MMANKTPQQNSYIQTILQDITLLAQRENLQDS